MSRYFDTVLNIRIAREQKEKLDAIASLYNEKSARLVRECIECFTSQENCLIRKKYKTKG